MIGLLFSRMPAAIEACYRAARLGYRKPFTAVFESYNMLNS